MKWGYLAGGTIALALLVVAALFLPSYFARKGIDRLAAALPDGETFTYSDVHYALLSRTLALKGGVLHIADPKMDVQVGEIDMQDANPSLNAAVEKAQGGAASADHSTEIARIITVHDLHSLYGQIDVKIGSIEVDAPRLFLAELLAPLPPLKSDSSITDSLPNGAQMRDMMQIGARANLATAYDKMEAKAIAASIPGLVPNQTVTVTIGAVQSLGFDRGNVKSASGTDVAVKINNTDISIGTIAIDGADHRPLLTAMRDGDTIESALNLYQGMNEKLSGIVLRLNDKPTGTIEEIALTNIAYRNALPASFDLTVKNLMIDRSFMPGAPPNSILSALGYTQPSFNGALSYRLDADNKQATNIRVNLDQGGTLTMGVVATDIQPGAPQATKIGSLVIQYDDQSLAMRWLGYVAQKTHGSIDSVKQGYIAWLEAQKPRYAGDLPLLSAIGAVESFVGNPHQLTFALQPPVPVGIADFDRSHPETFTAKLGLSVTAQ